MALPECCPDPVGHCVWRQDSPGIEQRFVADTVHTLRQCMKNKALHSPLEGAGMVHKNVLVSLSKIPGVTKPAAAFAALSLAVEAGFPSRNQHTQTHHCHDTEERQRGIEGFQSHQG